MSSALASDRPWRPWGVKLRAYLGDLPGTWLCGSALATPTTTFPGLSSHALQVPPLAEPTSSACTLTKQAIIPLLVAGFGLLGDGMVEFNVNTHEGFGVMTFFQVPPLDLAGAWKVNITYDDGQPGRVIRIAEEFSPSYQAYSESF